jgi:hypothetical protein
MNFKNKNGFIPIEIELHEKLNWDFDLIIQCLNCIRLELPLILNIDKQFIEVFLTTITNFIGNNYPVIGIRIKADFLNLVVIDVFEIEEKIEIWIKKNGGLEELKKVSKKLETINWFLLQEIKEHPKFLK